MDRVQYVTNLFVEDKSLRKSIAEVLESAGVPAISVSHEVAKTLYMLVKISGARRVLEIGCLGGYSTIWLAKALPDNGTLLSLEYFSSLAMFASENVKSEGLSDRVRFKIGHALDSLSELETNGEKFDFFFIDADKENYVKYPEYAKKLALPGAIITADNVLWRDRILDVSNDLSTKNIKEFNTKLATDNELDSMILTIGDGLAVAKVYAK